MIGPRQRPSPLVRALAVLVAALAAVLLSAGPAAAHASLVSSDPADGAVLAVAPPQVTLVFSEVINADQVAVTLTGADGAQPPLAAAAVSGATVTQPLPALPAGAVTVAYRVVSADGHTIQGELGVTFQGTPTPTPTSVPATTATTATPQPVVVDVAPEAEVESSSTAGPGFAVAGAVVLVALAVVVVARRRRT